MFSPPKMGYATYLWKKGDMYCISIYFYIATVYAKKVTKMPIFKLESRPGTEYGPNRP
jgi:hypothetical protein